LSGNDYPGYTDPGSGQYLLGGLHSRAGGVDVIHQQHRCGRNLFQGKGPGQVVLSLQRVELMLSRCGPHPHQSLRPMSQTCPLAKGLADQGGLVVAPLPQALRMKRDGHHRIVQAIGPTGA
jgi:hypothetical protein